MNFQPSSSELTDALNLASLIASKMALKKPNLDMDELKSVANLAIAEAGIDFDPVKGSYLSRVSFLITHRILDHFRQNDWATRDHRRELKREDQAAGDSVLEFDHHAGKDQISLDAPFAPYTDIPLLAFIGTGEFQSVVDRKLTVGRLLDSIKDRRQRKVIALLLGGLTQRQVGERLGVTEGRISQILKVIVGKMQGRVPALPHCKVCGANLLNDGRTRRQKQFCSRACRNSIAPPRPCVEIDPVVLHDLYLRQRLSIIKISQRLNVGRHAVWSSLKRFNISIRPAAVALALHCVECENAVFQRRRCRFHYNLKNARWATAHRVHKPQTSEQRSAHSLRVWEIRRERYGSKGLRKGIS